MITWCKNDDLFIESDIEPRVAVRVILPTDSEALVKSKNKYPFVNKKTIKWTVKAGAVSYVITINKNYCYDGASIPRAFWRLVGSKESNEFLVPALVHDYLCEHHGLIGYDRELSSEVFKQLLIACGVSKFKANIMYFAVNNYQRFCGWDK